MTTFKARLEREKLIIENLTTTPVFVYEVRVKYETTVETIEGKEALRTISDTISVNKEIKDKMEIPLVFQDVAEVSIVYKKGDTTLREDISV